MSDSDSSSDESSGDGIEIMISNLESSDYDGHLKIIAKCKKEGELDFLRNGLIVNQADQLRWFWSENLFFIHLTSIECGRYPALQSGARLTESVISPRFRMREYSYGDRPEETSLFMKQK